MTRLFKLVVVMVVMVVMSSAATSQPFGHPDASKRSDFEWNSRKIGSRRVATIRIRKDEERDRRSIFLGDDDDEDSAHGPHHHDSVSGRGRRRPHAHRHHHGGEAPDAAWLTPGEIEGKVGGGSSALGRHRGQGDSGRRRSSSPRRVAELSSGRRNINEIEPEDLSHLVHDLEAAGVDLSRYLRHNATTTARPKQRRQRGKNRSGRGPKRRKNKKNKKKKKAKKRGGKKGSKACRGLKGQRKKDCRNAFKNCRRMRGHEKKLCRSQASEAFPSATENQDMFSFIRDTVEMTGSDACQYHDLAQCCKEVGLLTHPLHSLKPVVKCNLREEFLKCMQKQREGTCDPSFHTRGNMTALRNKIKEVIWTSNSCLISEVEEG